MQNSEKYELLFVYWFTLGKKILFLETLKSYLKLKFFIYF